MTARLRLVLLALFPAATIALAALTLVALQTGEARVGPVTLMKMAAGYSRAAEARLGGPAPDAEAIAQAEALSRKALAEYPYDNNSWLRLAYADRLKHGRLTAEGVEYLRRSYALSAADIYVGVWRIAFVLENSQAVPKDVRAAAKSEFVILWKDYRQRARLKQVPVALSNPAGRLSALLWLNAAKANAAN